MALVIDGILIAIPTALFVGIIGFGALDTGATATLAASGLGTLFGLAYYALLDGSERGQTVGKMAMGVQVRDERTGGPIGYGKGVVRHVLQTVAGFFSCVGLVFVLVDGLFPLWDPKRQTLHDKVAGTVVIDARRGR